MRPQGDVLRTLFLVLAILALSFALWWLVIQDVDAAEADETSCVALTGTTSPTRCTCVGAQRVTVEQEDPQRLELWRQWEWCAEPAHPEAGFLMLRRFYKIDTAQGVVQRPVTDGSEVLYDSGHRCRDSLMTAPLY